MEEVPCRTSRAPLASLCFWLIFNRSGSKGAFRLPGPAWDHFRCTVEPSPGQWHTRCWKTTPFEWGSWSVRVGIAVFWDAPMLAKTKPILRIMRGIFFEKYPCHARRSPQPPKNAKSGRRQHRLENTKSKTFFDLITLDYSQDQKMSFNQNIFQGCFFFPKFPCDKNDYMQLLLFWGINFLTITITTTFLNP